MFILVHILKVISLLLSPFSFTFFFRYPPLINPRITHHGHISQCHPKRSNYTWFRSPFVRCKMCSVLKIIKNHHQKPAYCYQLPKLVSTHGFPKTSKSSLESTPCHAPATQVVPWVKLKLKDLLPWYWWVTLSLIKHPTLSPHWSYLRTKLELLYINAANMLFQCKHKLLILVFFLRKYY